MSETSLKKVGRYEILRELGRGTMGIVYLAEDPALQRNVALKTIDIAFQVPAAERAGFEERFGVEARIAGRLSHPGLVVVHDVGRDADTGILYMALEYLEGRTLADVAATGELPPWRETLAIVAKLARALHHAHENGVVHRDVKPANVMLLHTGEPKIMDFGIAKSPHIELTSAGQLFGTPLYMSPEQALGLPVDGRSDLFSLGSIAYMLLAGAQAFRADNVFQVLARVAQEQPTPATELQPALPHDVDVFLARALAKAPADRYQDGQAMARDAEALIEGRPLTPAVPDDHESPLSVLVADEAAPGLTQTRMIPPPAPAAPATPRRAFPAGLVVAALAVLLVAAVIVAIWPGRSRPVPAAAVAAPAAGVAPIAPPVGTPTPGAARRRSAGDRLRAPPEERPPARVRRRRDGARGGARRAPYQEGPPLQGQPGRRARDDRRRARKAHGARAAQVGGQRARAERRRHLPRRRHPPPARARRTPAGGPLGAARVDRRRS